ncbi:MAG: DUF3052 domain-containing protein [Deltaproteobacteria bacterium]|nr:DUF3052 domain-containing protein [Deltaproteobacteria bacterium]
MAGYSGTPLPRKLGIKDGHRVLFLGAPAGFADTLQPLPDGVTLLTRAGTGPYDVMVAFLKTRVELAAAVDNLKPRMDPAAGLWVAWPKKASGVVTELTEDLVRLAGLEAGLVDNKVCAIDETWSGLRLVVRKRDRPRR